MKRWVFNVLAGWAAAGSMVMLVAAVGLWISSYWWVTRADHVAAKSYVSITSELGSVRLEFVKYTMGGEMPDMWRLDATRVTTEARSSVLGHTDVTGGFDPRWHRRQWWAGHWMFVLVFSVLPAIWAMRRRARMRRVSLNLCLNCGYDLRATPERCPECGAVPSTQTAGSGSS